MGLPKIQIILIDCTPLVLQLLVLRKGTLSSRRSTGRNRSDPITCQTRAAAFLLEMLVRTIPLQSYKAPVVTVGLFFNFFLTTCG